MKDSGKIQQSRRDAGVTEVQRPTIEFGVWVEIALMQVLSGERPGQSERNDFAWFAQ